MTNVFAYRLHAHTAHLQSVDMTGARLMNANLHNATLRGANLTRASLVRANVSGTFFRYANLTNSDFRNATNCRDSGRDPRSVAVLVGLGCRT